MIDFNDRTPALNLIRLHMTFPTQNLRFTRSGLLTRPNSMRLGAGPVVALLLAAIYPAMADPQGPTAPATSKAVPAAAGAGDSDFCTATTPSGTAASPNCDTAQSGSEATPAVASSPAKTSAAAPAQAATAVVTPTDQAPPEVPSPRPLTLFNRTNIGGAVDTRYAWSGYGPTDTPWIQDAEIDVTYPVVVQSATRGNLVLQAMDENAPDVDGGSGVALGEAYAIYKLPINVEADSTAYIKVGQFQIPFALLAVYDPHEELTQPLYSEALGLRNDWGADVSGRFYQSLNYDFAITRGVGPSVVGQVDPSRVVTFRLGRTFETELGTVNVGGSILAGRLPVTDIDAAHLYAVNLPPSGRVDADQGYIDKSRVAGDATMDFGRLTARGEAMLGADDDQRVAGYYVTGEYKITGNTQYLIGRTFWRYPLGDSYFADNQIGLTYASTSNVTWRALLENVENKPRDLDIILYNRLTVQVLFRF